MEIFHLPSCLEPFPLFSHLKTFRHFNHFEIRMHRFVFSKVILINLMFHLIIILTKFLKHFPHHHLLQLPYIHVL